MIATKPSQASPGEPYRLMSYFVFLTVIGAGVLLALNWKKLGKPEWQGRTIILSIFLPIIMVALALVWVILVIPHPELPMQFILSLPMLALGANFGFIWALARLQSGAYKIFTREGFESLQRYEYDVDGALFFGGMVTLIWTVIGVFVIPLL
jgi:hypothetical protein